MSTKLPLLFSLLLLTSCQVYRSDFDCAPSRGVPCTSVSEIEKMIIETPEGGPDLFLEQPIREAFPCCNELQMGKCKSNLKRIWVEECCERESSVEGHYIYFEDDCDD